MTIETVTANRTNILATFEKRRRIIDSRKVEGTRFLLCWPHEGSALFVGVDALSGRAFATGFEHAYTWPTINAADTYCRTNHIRNGKDERPTPMADFTAKATALADLDGVIATLKTMEG